MYSKTKSRVKPFSRYPTVLVLRLERRNMHEWELLDRTGRIGREG